jgi:hypothetical protein
MEEPRETMAGQSTDAQEAAGDAPGGASSADVLELLELLGPAGAARDPLETLRDARACARALLFDDLAALVSAADWRAARASAAVVRLSSDAFGNDYFARAPSGEPLGVALGIAIRLTISSAIARLHEGVVGLTLLHGAR